VIDARDSEALQAFITYITSITYITFITSITSSRYDPSLLTRDSYVAQIATWPPSDR
jgi:hypothetical protein